SSLLAAPVAAQMSDPEAEVLSAAPISKIGPISRLSAQLLRGPLQCPRVVHTDLSWQLSRLLCAGGEWPPCRRPAEHCDKLAPRCVVHIGSRTALLPPRWLRGRDSWIGQLQGLQGIDQTGAEIVIALAGREPLCARGQDATNVRRSQFRIA